MSRNTTCIDDDHHQLFVDVGSVACSDPAREFEVDIICAKCQATAKHYIYSEDENWSEPCQTDG